MDEELKIVISAETADIKKGCKEATQEIEKLSKKSKVNLKNLGEGFKKAGDVAKKGLKVAAGAIAGVTTALLALGPATKEYREGQAKLQTAFESAGGSAEEAKNTYNDLYRVLGDSDVAVEASNHLAKLTTNQQELSQWTNICQGVYATFGDSLPIEGLTEAANETAKTGALTGSLADALNWAGVNEEEFQAKLDACNTEAEREATIRETLNGLYSEASSKYEENAAAILAQNEANANMQASLATLGEAMTPINTMLTQFGSDVLNTITPIIVDFVETHGPQLEAILDSVATAIGNALTWLIDNWETVSTIATIIAGVVAVLTTLSVVMGIVNALMVPQNLMILAIVAAITAVVAIIVLCVKHWDEIKAKVSEVVEAIKQKVEDMKNAIKEKWENIKTAVSEKIDAIKQGAIDKWEALKEGVQEKITNLKEGAIEKFNSIKQGIVDKIEWAKDKLKGIIDKIKGFFNFKWELPKIKLPHFSITGKFSLHPPQIPKFGVSWYQNGGVFDSPTLFGYGSHIGGLGENGAEAIVPLEKNTKWLDKIAERLGGNGQPIILQVDGTTFGKVAVKSINSFTRQTGSLQLQII